MSKLKLPPYGAYLRNLLASGQKPTKSPWIYCGMNAWKKVNHHQYINQFKTSMCLPPWESGLAFLWPVAGLELVVVDTGGCDDDYLEELMCALLRDGARHVALLTATAGIFYFKKDLKNERPEL